MYSTMMNRYGAGPLLSAEGESKQSWNQARTLADRLIPVLWRQQLLPPFFGPIV